MCKLLGIHAVAAFMQLELFRVHNLLLWLYAAKNKGTLFFMNGRACWN
ncbi:hypothetical protein Q7O_003238 [Pectobacterium carotovorum subsp. carotovorum PCCS1]|nr:hypothetical protein [Pectobacterium carotovorum subsp. carotovorum PCCS1]